MQTFAEGLLTYGLGRAITYRDMPAVRTIVREGKRDDWRFNEMVWQVVKSDAFLKRRAPEPKQVVAEARAGSTAGQDIAAQAAAPGVTARSAAAR